VKIKESYKTPAIGILLLVALLALGSYPGTSQILQRLNWVIYDILLPLQSPPLSDEVVVIAIDDSSLQELGRWPWSRTTHAKLIKQLTRMQARAVGLDIIFAEHEQTNPLADRQLELALLENKRSVLVVAPVKQNSQPIDELLPIPELASAAAALGHVDIELDIDGLCRSTYLYSGLNKAEWPTFALALLKVGGIQPRVPNAEQAEGVAQSDGWLRQHKILIPFSKQRQIKQFSYSDVLAGRIQDSQIKDKFVLIGATAAGLGDEISTPGAFSHERLPGIVLNAEILNGLLQESVITEASGFLQTVATSVLIIMTVVGIILLSSHFHWFISLAGMGLTLLLTVILLVYSQTWFAPAAALLSIILAWPLWSIWKTHQADHLKHRLLQQLEHQAKHHLATGLPNLNMLDNQLSLLSEKDDSTFTGLMVLHINWPGSASVVIDRPISDPVLKTISDRLKSICREQDFIAHLSGDDFAILSSGYENEEAVQQSANNLLSELQKPLEYQNENLLLAPQIGLSIWPKDTLDARSLLRNAYTAMFKSRIDEVDHLCVYSSIIGNELQNRSQLEQALLFALERDEFELFYQPQVDANSEKITGVEVLLRWNSPKLGWVSPETFIPVAEHIGLIKKIGDWIFEAACFQLQLWNRSGINSLRLAINISPLQFMAPGLSDRIGRILEKYNINPGDIELEITESSLMREMDAAIKAMRSIKEKGIELAIDDFGTGYSSLSNIRLFPLDRLKIDKSFTQEIGSNPDVTEITLTILAMGKTLGLNVIAEGVEKPQQAEFLRRHGCDEFQGYLYGKPLEVEEITHLLLSEAD